MLSSLFIILFLFAKVESRVTFTTSEVLDDVDLRETDTASFRCYAGCRVYSPTGNADIVIVDSKGTEYKTLMDLAELTTGEFIELPPSSDLYSLKNNGPANPSFVLYAVERGATNYEAKVLYVTAGSQIRVQPKTDSLLTIISTSGAVRFSNFTGDYSDALPSVYATGFDSISGSSACRPVYQARSVSTLVNTAFPVYSPIVTIDFGESGEDKSVVISGEAFPSTSDGSDTSAVYVSPGYVGCRSTGDSLYTHASAIAATDSSFRVSDSHGVSVLIDGDYRISKNGDALTLTINDDVQKLVGTSLLNETYEGTDFKFRLSWSKRQGSLDRFAMQIDVIVNEAVDTTMLPTSTESLTESQSTTDMEHIRSTPSESRTEITANTPTTTQTSTSASTTSSNSQSTTSKSGRVIETSISILSIFASFLL